MGDACTEEQATGWLRSDVGSAEVAVSELVAVALKQGQFDALVSFTFNLERGTLAGSTRLTKLNDGNYTGAAAEFDKWVLAGGHVREGLRQRRAAERAMLEAAGDNADA